MNKALEGDKLKVGISLGDINGIGPEVVLKSFAEPAMLELFTPVVYGSNKVLSFYKNTLGEMELHIQNIHQAEEAHPKKLNVINCWKEEVKIEPGISNETGAKYAVLSLEAAVKDLKEGKIQCLVTAPIDKSHLASQQFDFPGHTEYLAQKGGAEPLMIMVHDELRVALVTGHIALKDISAQLTKEKIIQKLNIFYQSLMKDFNIRKPKIAILSLNPHAGDGGKFGDEEEKVIIPAIQHATERNMVVMGPYPADGFFASGNYKKFDGILAMYHDQGLIPFKTISAINGVNYTAGLPFVRTSPDHGAAFDLAGKNMASEASFREAIYLACDIYTTRKNNREYSKNPLKRLSQDLDQKEDEELKVD